MYPRSLRVRYLPVLCIVYGYLSLMLPSLMLPQSYATTSLMLPPVGVIEIILSCADLAYTDEAILLS